MRTLRLFLGLLYPTLPAVAVLLLFIIGQLLVGGYTFDLETKEVTTDLGLGGPITFVEKDHRQFIRINWSVLLINLISCYVAAVCTARCLNRSPRLVLGLRYCAMLWGALALISVPIAMETSHSYWGYYLWRPDLPHQIQQVSRVKAVVPVATEGDPTTGYRLTAQKMKRTLTEILDSCTHDPYYCLNERIMVHLKAKNLLSKGYFGKIADLENAYDDLDRTEILLPGAAGYPMAKSLFGTITEAVDHQGRTLIFICVNGGQVSNDHYPYYEFVFTRSAPGVPPVLLNSQHFFYDVAGYEGVEAGAILLLIMFPFTLFGLPLLLFLWMLIPVVVLRVKYTLLM